MNTRHLSGLVLGLVVLAGCQGFGTGVSPTHTSTPTPTPATEPPPSQTEEVPVVTEEFHPVWSLSLFFEDVTPEPGGEFKAYVATEGHFRGTVTGVTVQFIAENGTVVAEVPVGNITTLGTPHWVNTTVPTLPVTIVPKVEDWETGDANFTQIEGQHITADGEFHAYSVSDPANFTR